MGLRLGAAARWSDGRAKEGARRGRAGCYPHLVSPRERIENMVKTVLGPLLQSDGGGVEIVRFEGSVLTLRLTGALHGCPGTPFVKRRVVEPAVRQAAGKDIEIVYERPSVL